MDYFLLPHAGLCVYFRIFFPEKTKSISFASTSFIALFDFLSFVLCTIHCDFKERYPVCFALSEVFSVVSPCYVYVETGDTFGEKDSGLSVDFFFDWVIGGSFLFGRQLPDPSQDVYLLSILFVGNGFGQAEYRCAENPLYQRAGLWNVYLD